MTTPSAFPERLTKAVAKHFVEHDRKAALAILADYASRFHWLKDLERVRFDMVLISKGDLAKLAREAERDYRDVIMAAEYELREGKIVKRENIE